jgi:hypothetical protein
VLAKITPLLRTQAGAANRIARRAFDNDTLFNVATVGVPIAL